MRFQERKEDFFFRVCNFGAKFRRLLHLLRFKVAFKFATLVEILVKCEPGGGKLRQKKSLCINKSWLFLCYGDWEGNFKILFESFDGFDSLEKLTFHTREPLNFQHLTGKYLLLHPIFSSPVESNLTFARNVEKYYEKITLLYLRRNVNRNLGVVQTDGVVMKCRQEGGESHQLKENLLDASLRYSIMRPSSSEARYLQSALHIKMKIWFQTNKKLLWSRISETPLKHFLALTGAQETLS